MFRDDYGAKNPRTLQARMHCQTYAPSLTRAQPFNNLIRSAYYGLSAILGGVQSMHINSFDEPFATPTELSASLSVKTQQIINFETGITSVVDPLGGSYYVESLTDQLEEKAQEIIDDIESRGGSFKAFDLMKNQLRKEAIQLQDSIDSGKMVIVGTNEFVDEQDIQLKALEILQNHADFEAIKEYDPSIRDKQIARVEKVRKERDNAKLEKAMKELSDALNADDENIMPATIEAVKCYMTQGEYARVVAGANKQITRTDEEEFLG
jgi:methylmalonyl-CoA mutase N-terminal domain/subunit